MTGHQQRWPHSGGASKRCIIIGAGPAGLTAAYELSQANMAPLVFEQDTIVGGIARTVEYAGYRFDIGGHRFFTKVRSIDDWWKRMLGDDLLVRSRQSRIYYNGKFFDYPLKPLNAILGLGPFETTRVGLSYLAAQLFPHPIEDNLEQWVSNRFGRRLYEIFFKNYTEKVWGMKCTEIGADWAAQRIKNLDLNKLVRDMFVGTKKDEITTLITSFLYPRLGPGMLWEKVAQDLAERDFAVRLAHRVTKLHLENNKLAQITVTNSDGKQMTIEGDQFISSMPIKDLIASFDPPAPAACGRGIAQVAISRLFDCRTHRKKARRVQRQLDLYTLSECQSGTDPEFQELEPGDGAGYFQDFARARIFRPRRR